jgi:hypothetical protein
MDTFLSPLMALGGIATAIGAIFWTACSPGANKRRPPNALWPSRKRAYRPRPRAGTAQPLGRALGEPALLEWEKGGQKGGR